MLHVRCLGTFSLGSDDTWIAAPPFKRGREFLQYLVSYWRSAASREALVNAFWPTLDVQTAAHRLHLAVAGARAALRKLSPPLDGIRCLGGAYAWDPAIAIESDLEGLLAASRDASIQELQRAAATYGGEFLAGDVAEWMYPLRIRCANAYAVILERLAEDALARGDAAEALDYALRLVAEDRAHEGGTRLVMRSFVASGRRGAALAAYEALASYLDHHLALRPSSQTVELRRTIRDA